jgi:tetratricopeptide (TPR) repeat protein
MSRRPFAIALVLAGVALLAGPSAAQDKFEIPKVGVYTRKSPTIPAYPNGVIAAESPRGVTLKGRKGEVPEETIQDVVFEIRPFQVNNTYRLGIIAERKARASAKDREAERTKALAKYEEALAELNKLAAEGKLPEGQSFARAHLEYKVASLLYEQGTEDGKQPARQQAAARLKEFKTRNKQAWQLARTLRMLAQLQLDEKKYAEAEQTYRELAKVDAAPEVRQDAEVRAILVMMNQEGKQAEARKALEGLKASLPAGSPAQLRARLALAESLGMTKDAKDLARARDEVKAVLDAAKDKALRGVAYNTLGYCYYLNDQWQEARWEFLWVDVIYNQDPREHAKALYYLADIFGRLGEGERARECRDLLRSQQFSGTDYQRRLLQESKS